MHKEKLCDVDLLSDEQKADLDKFNETEDEFDDTKTVVDLFREQARKTPDNIAVVYKEKSFTYAQVDEISDRIAGFVHNKGIGKENVVSVLIPRCEYMVIASLGVLKAGAAYQPLDPSYPPERLNFMINDSSAKLLIADESLLELLPDYNGDILLTRIFLIFQNQMQLLKNHSWMIFGFEANVKKMMKGCTVISIEDELQEFMLTTAVRKPQAEEKKNTQRSLPSLKNTAYLIYTSGSTGKPKGVMLRHIGIANYLTYSDANIQVKYVVDNCKVYGSVTTISFDMSLKETMLSLCNGLTLVFASDEQTVNPVSLAKLFKENNVDVFNSTSSRLLQYMELGYFD